MKRRNRLSIAMMAALAASAVWACGPDFPNEVLDDRARTLAQLPEGAFVVEVARLLPRPSARFIANEPFDPWDANAEQQTLRESVEGQDLDANERSLVTGMRQADTAAAAYAMGEGLSDDLRHYVAGAVAWHQGELAIARDHFERALSANPAADARRASWAQYMLARVDAQDRNVDAAVAGFASVRTLVAAGAPDPLGLAVASFGEEAALQRDAHPTQALHLYVSQVASGSLSGANSVLMLAREAFADPALLQTWVADPLARQVAVAYAYSRAAELPYAEDADDDASDDARAARRPPILRLLEAIEAGADEQTAGLDRLAAVAYRAGRFDLAERLSTRDRSPLSAWVRAKLALRQGNRDAAASAYAEAAAGFPAEADTAQPFARSATEEARQSACRVQAELGTLNLARGEYVAAMDALYAAGGDYWMDAQYVADRVLTLDELRRFVAQHAAAAPTPAAQASEDESDQDGYGGYGNVVVQLRDLFARRLMRAGEYDEALPYFSDDQHREAAQQYASAMKQAKGGGFWMDRVGRAEAWFKAATTARAWGMEILGTEGAPDFEIWGGMYAKTSGHFDADWNWIPDPPGDLKLVGPWIGSDEPARLDASRPPYFSRFHYRQVAADHLMQAADYVPARSQAFAAMLCIGHGWLVNREPEAASVLYRRYVAEGPLVPFAAHFGHDCPAPEFDRARERLKFERVRAAKISIRRYGPSAAAIGLLVVGAWFWRRRKRAVT